MCGDFTPPSVVYGVVYGFDDQTRRMPDGENGTWVCRGVVADEALTVDRCAPVEDWFGDPTPAGSTPAPTGSSDSSDPLDSPDPPDSPDSPDSTDPPDPTDTARSSGGDPSLTTFLADLPSTAAAGLDFPFGLPERLVAEDTWTDFLRDLPTWCSGPEDFRWQCERRVELVDDDARVRATDAPLSALSPFDERIAASTFFGLRDVLRPLVLSDRVRVPPMTSPRPDRPFVIEVYPAGTLVDLDLDPPVGAGEGDDGTARREATLDDLSAAIDCDLSVDAAAREHVVGADAALESLVAAYVVYRNTRDAAALSVSDPQRLVEGQVFV